MTLVSFIIHFSLYAVLGFLVARAMVGSGQVAPSLLLFGLALCTLFGILDELYQLTVPGRGFEWIDILADGLGSAVGLFVFAMLRGRKMTGDGGRGIRRGIR